MNSSNAKFRLLGCLAFDSLLLLGLGVPDAVPNVLKRQGLDSPVNQHVDVRLHAPCDGLKPLHLKRLLDLAEAKLDTVQHRHIRYVKDVFY